VQGYAVEIERGIGVSRARFASTVEETLARERGWTTPGIRAFRRVEGSAAAFRVTLASPRTTDRLCALLSTNGRYSCFNAGRAVLNARHWLRGASAYRGGWPTTGGATWSTTRSGTRSASGTCAAAAAEPARR
jgi:hypothetical protein